MEHTLWYALIGLLCFGINDIIFKRAAQQGASSHNMMMALSLTMLPLMLIYGVVTRELSTNPAALWGAVGAVFTYVGFYNFSNALKFGAVSIAAPVFRLSFIVTALLAIVFLAESLTIIKLSGLAVAVIAAWLLLGGTSNAKVEISRDALVRVLIATGSVGIAFFCFKVGIFQGATPASVLLAQTIGLSSVATATSIAIDKRFFASQVAVRHGVIFGIIQSIGFGSIVEGLVKGEVSILFPIAQLSFLITALIGLVFLKEQVTARKTAGLIAAVGAVALLGLAARA